MSDLETRVARLEKQVLSLIARLESHTHKYGTSVVNCREVELRTERPTA